MKNVLSFDMVAHKFANQLQDSARTSGRNFYFENDAIYSYGRHFCIAKHVTNEAGERALLFTTQRYSNTTAKHISIVRSASNHLNTIYCNDPQAGVSLNIESFERGIKAALKGLLNARKPEKYINQAEYIYSQVEKYTSFFGIEIPESINELMQSAKSGKYAEYLSLEAERIEAERKANEEKRIKEFKKSLTKWRKGELPRIYGRLHDRDFLRFNGKRIETSQGVEIPMEVGKRAFKWILKAIENGGCNGECNFKILDFEVKEVTSKLITIGCHKIDIVEIKRIAKQLNW